MAVALAMALDLVHRKRVGGGWRVLAYIGRGVLVAGVGVVCAAVFDPTGSLSALPDFGGDPVASLHHLGLGRDPLVAPAQRAFVQSLRLGGASGGRV